MDGKKLIFYSALAAPLIYEITMVIFNLDGLSIYKLFLTALVWLSVGISISLFIRENRLVKRAIPKLPYIVLVILFIWNFACIFKSVFDSTGTFTTLFGNVNTALSLLVPFAFVFSIYRINLKFIYKYFIALLFTGTFLVFTFIAINGGSFTPIQSKILFLLFLPVIFLITLYPYLKRKHKKVVILSGIALFYVALNFGSRTMLVREILLLIALFAIFISGRYKLKWVNRIAFVALLIPFILLQLSLESGESAIQRYFSDSLDNDSSLSTDTRTFLYTELYDDLNGNKQLILGKGANATYYSDYFSTEEGDSDTRLGIEVGVLAYLLRGGFLAVFLNLLILIIAIYYALFRSNNHFVIGIGYMLIVHGLLLFIENLITYNSYNFIIWFFIGVCLNKGIRLMSNKDIAILLHGYRKLI